MKRLFTLLLISVLISGNFQIFAQQAKDSDSTSFAQITFEVTDHSFGEVTQGEKVEHIFKFKNTGNFPLILQNVLTTCGCTVPEWPKEPIAPAEEGILRVIFDSTAKIGRQNKVITIRSNSKSGDYRLRISAMVLPPKEDE
jgi:hypothetical protein